MKKGNFWGKSRQQEEEPPAPQPIRTYMENGHLVRVFAPAYAYGAGDNRTPPGSIADAIAG